MSLDELNYDVFLCIVYFLDAVNLIALSKCSQRLREHALSYQSWAVLGKNLILSGIALPTEGFRTPDELSPGELRASVMKSYRISRTWTSAKARACSIKTIIEERHARNVRAQAVTRIIPITSDILMMQLGDEGLIIWDVASSLKLAELSHARMDLDDSVASFAVDLETKCFYGMAHYSPMDGDPYMIKLLKLDFSQMDNHGASTEKLGKFEEVACFASFDTYRSSRDNICFGRGQILGTKERCLSQLYTRGDILLYIVLDWNERKAAFVNTGIKPFQSHFAQNYCCTWDASNKRLILNVDWGVGFVCQHVYDVAQFLPFLRSFDELVPRICDVNQLPRLRPLHFFTLKYAHSHSFSGPLASRQPFSFRTPWHRFNGTCSPAPCTSVFVDYDDTGRRIRGNMLVPFPPVDTHEDSHSASVSIVSEGPDRLTAPAMSAQYGALAWVEGQYRALQDIRIARFFHLSANEVQRCTPLLPDGQPVELESGYRQNYSGLSSLSLDVVHGRLFLVYDTGKILALHFC